MKSLKVLLASCLIGICCKAEAKEIVLDIDLQIPPQTQVESKPVCINGNRFLIFRFTHASGVVKQFKKGLFLYNIKTKIKRPMPCKKSIAA